MYIGLYYILVEIVFNNMFYTDFFLDNSDIAQIFINIHEITHLLYNRYVKIMRAYF
jgi:hypothetical protein